MHNANHHIITCYQFSMLDKLGIKATTGVYQTSFIPKWWHGIYEIPRLW